MSYPVCHINSLYQQSIKLLKKSHINLTMHGLYCSRKAEEPQPHHSPLHGCYCGLVVPKEKIVRLKQRPFYFKIVQCFDPTFWWLLVRCQDDKYCQYDHLILSQRLHCLDQTSSLLLHIQSKHYVDTISSGVNKPQGLHVFFNIMVQTSFM